MQLIDYYQNKQGHVNYKIFNIFIKNILGKLFFINELYLLSYCHNFFDNIAFLNKFFVYELYIYIINGIKWYIKNNFQTYVNQ